MAPIRYMKEDAERIGVTDVWHLHVYDKTRAHETVESRELVT